MGGARQYSPIGTVLNRIESLDAAPKQGPEAGLSSIIELDPAWAEGLEGLKPGRWLWVLCLYDQAGPAKLKVHPRGDRSRPLTGLFNTRSPHRPNPISLTLVRLESLEGNRLTVKGLEAVDGTPVLDLKPWIPGVDEPREES
ncbi:MAG: tRNA (N6-threonylcarbamoyladenosine(37)-N6)-methyltransferase TrmO [Desulfarculaceae bacterium]|nr:tRNA (N6-threonylcarbamoyladenosine(37)-N6)-methyltransferase TrmO [Desulfarculaceae bacterium]MCF8074107.1 tRNA (N6-threonylcarbamoyladenosine(37)-N6)-methyltransferase TrmO [Desulfarculaceae bacterium]MCF8103770.1 tRNA (N6-threonylcarbamoyladenosine(37)-N6)-methyltransferase TrmO [Desulfarculaceae bacterium]MCF8116841.1 tRNA (N6-threonylcarbamoyladenosine(37)-N6)-methyltransferase TrmO [Desulfarculaceae bacterium]